MLFHILFIIFATSFIDNHYFMQAVNLNKYQERVVNLMSHVDTDEQMEEINMLLSQYFAKKAFDAADKLWDEGFIGEQMIEEWKEEHMRTPYRR